MTMVLQSFNICSLLALLLGLSSNQAVTQEPRTWAVKIKPNSLLFSPDADQIANHLGLTNAGRVHPFPDVYKFTVTASNSPTTSDLRSHPNIEWSSRQVRLKRSKRLQFNDPQFGHQWHLLNTRERGHDVNATGIWAQGVTGRGVVVAVVDDGLEYSNRDLLPNYVSHIIICSNIYYMFSRSYGD